MRSQSKWFTLGPAATTYRRGTVLVMTAISLTASVAMLALVVESSRMMARSSEVQIAADSTALVAAQMLNQQATNSAARLAAVNFGSTYNGVQSGAYTLNFPPTSGPYAGQQGYVESLVSSPYSTPLATVLGGTRNTMLHGRAVAGPKATPWPDLLLALDPQSIPGIVGSGTGQLRVEGAVRTNSVGGGLDEKGQPISGATGFGIQLAQAGRMVASEVRVCGGVNDPTYFSGLTGTAPNPLVCRVGTTIDPFKNLPTPTAALGVSVLLRGEGRSTSASTNLTLRPGLYTNIIVTAGTVTFQPGIYVIRGGSLTLTGGNISGQGVMFYLTGTDYSALYGTPDNADGENLPANASTMGSVTISTRVNLTGFSSASSPFNGMLIHTRRFNTNPILFASPQNSGTLTGTVYSKWGPLTLSGTGVYNLQFVTRRATWNGSSGLTLSRESATFMTTNQVFLLE
jgi:hypothetical protein